MTSVNDEMHVRSMKKKRRIINILDCIGATGNFFMLEADELMDLIFSNVEARGSAVDSIIWDIEYFYKDSYKPIMKRWQEQGHDIVQMIIDRTKHRGIECMLNFRMNEVGWKPNRPLEDTNPPYPWEEIFYRNTDSIKKREHPDWCLHASWWDEPLFNYGSEGVREMVIGQITELMLKYEFDGVLLDFSRHVPVLPAGRQWILRGCLTDMIKKVKGRLEGIERNQDRAVLLCTKVPSREEGCKIDGFEVKKWVFEGIVDLLILGSRTMDVDIEFYKRLVEGTGIQIYPCIDGHHATDGYRSPGIEWFRGLISSWLHRGVDGFAAFNFSASIPQIHEKYGMPEDDNFRDGRRVFRECGDAEKMRYQDKKFVVERKWGFPWSEGFFNQNASAPLPACLTMGVGECYHRNTLKTVIYVSDDIAGEIDRIKKIQFSVLYSQPLAPERICVKLNGITLEMLAVDTGYKDAQITDYRDEKPISGGREQRYTIDPSQKLAKVFYKTEAEAFEHGNNFIEISLNGTGIPDVKIEKIELEITYL